MDRARSDRPDGDGEKGPERRQWVRLVSVCNNRCTFCLDRGAMDGRVRPAEEIAADLEQGRSRGATRAVLSGGEPTLHPDLSGIIRLAGSLGYRWVQIVTNGRRLAYPAFLEALVRAGLDEITFSIHGCSPDVHDALVGVPGAFDQTMRGLRAAVAAGGLVVSVDVVLNRRNIGTLDTLVDLALSVGVREFDLLWPVPFGGAADYLGSPRRFYLDGGDVPRLHRAIDRATRAGAVVWTNRVPPRYLEGRENLIQDPSKFQDEVRGRSIQISELVERGVALRCRDGRCRRCPLDDFCDFLHLAARRSRGEGRGVPPAIRLDPAVPGHLDRLGALPWRRARAGTLWLRTSASAELWDPRVDEALRRFRRVRLEAPASVLVETAARLPPGATLQLRPGPGDVALPASLLELPFVLVLPWTGGLADALRRAGPARPAGRARLVLGCPAAGLAARHGWGPGAASLRAIGRARGRVGGVEDLPACLSGGAPVVRSPDVFDLGWLRPDGTLGVEALAAWFVDERHRAWSCRCVRCTARRGCPGIPVSMVRLVGFRVLRPVARGSVA